MFFEPVAITEDEIVQFGKKLIHSFSAQTRKGLGRRFAAVSSPVAGTPAINSGCA